MWRLLAVLLILILALGGLGLILAGALQIRAGRANTSTVRIHVDQPVIKTDPALRAICAHVIAEQTFAAEMRALALARYRVDSQAPATVRAIDRELSAARAVRLRGGC